MWTEIAVGSVSLGMLGTVASLGDGERPGLSGTAAPASPCGASCHPSRDLGTGAAIPQFCKVISPTKNPVEAL